MESRILKILVSLGVPGVALGIFYLLFKSLNFTFPAVPPLWVGPIVVLFMVIVGGITFYALTLWAPTHKIAGNGISFSPPKGATFEFVINSLAAQDGKTVEYIGFNKEDLKVEITPQNITAASIDQSMELVRGLTGGAVPPYKVTRSTYGSYILSTT